MFSIFGRCRCKPIVDTMQYIDLDWSLWYWIAFIAILVLFFSLVIYGLNDL